MTEQEKELLERFKAIRESIDFQWRVACATNTSTIAVNTADAGLLYALLTYAIETAEQKMKESESNDG